MAIKEVRREWDECQLGYTKEFILHKEADVAKLPKCCTGSTAIVGETGNVYTVGKDKTWKKREKAMEEAENTPSGGGGLPTGGTPHQVLVTDKDGNAVWEDKLCYTEGELVLIAPEKSYNNAKDDPFVRTDTPLVEGETYTVVWNGVGHELVLGKGASGSLGFWGAPNFGLEYMHPNLFIFTSDEILDDPFTISIHKGAKKVKKIPEEYMPYGRVVSDRVELVSEASSIIAASDIVPLYGSLIPGKTYTVVWDGVEYSCVAMTASESGVYGLGNNYILGFPGYDTTDTGEPFALLQPPGEMGIVSIMPDVNPVTFSIIGPVDCVKKIPREVIPESKVPTYSYIPIYDRDGNLSVSVGDSDMMDKLLSEFNAYGHVPYLLVSGGNKSFGYHFASIDYDTYTMYFAEAGGTRRIALTSDKKASYVE